MRMMRIPAADRARRWDSCQRPALLSAVELGQASPSASLQENPEDQQSSLRRTYLPSHLDPRTALLPLLAQLTLELAPLLSSTTLAAVLSV